MRLSVLLLGVGLFASPASAQVVAPSDPADYPAAPGREEAVAFCGACHSFRLVAAQGLTRLQWDETMKWMVQRHNMPELHPQDHDIILDYLERAFPPKASGGRPGWTNPFAPHQ
ncbi:MAG: hypothetical protein IT555_08280 [Acetobacteraceae bacterium]|nr:hypothetical protein [Acetobacteraceae bacterium]